MSSDRHNRTLLILSQVYVPDPASVGQYMADAAAAMVRRGWRVRVLTANRGYEDPAIKYPTRETIDGVEIRRLPFSSFGKRSIPVRLIGATLFLLQSIVHGLMTRKLGCILVSTSPPICPIAAIVVGALRRVPIKYWVMDLNPDQMIALGRLSATSLPVRIFDAMNRVILRQAQAVVALDRYMAKRLIAKQPIDEKLTVLPPWPHQDHLDTVDHDSNPFRHEHGLDDKFVIMFSGNLSIASPATTVLEASLRLKDLQRLMFVFVGGGLGRLELDRFIEQHRPANILALPYQPFDKIRYSLSAADVHLVTMGDQIVGICHPCKVYGAMAVAKPILLLGPEECHITDLIRDYRIGWRISHGDVDAAESTIRDIVDTDPNEMAAMGARARESIDQRYSNRKLCGAFCDVLEGKNH